MRRTIRFRSLVCLWAASVSLALGTTWASAATPPPVEQPNCGDVIDHSFILQSDLDCPVVGASGLEIGADGITIDLNGNTITGDDAKIGILFFNPQSKVRIHNGQIEHFSEGVSSTGDANVFEDLTLRNNGTAMNLGGLKNTVRNNVAVNNTGHGFNLTSSLDGSKIERNTAYDNGLVGFRIFGDKNKFAGNSSSTNDSFGIEVTGDGNKITSNTVTGNGTDGVGGQSHGIRVFSNANDTSISKNVVTANFETGIAVLSGAAPTSVVSNVVSANGEFGISGNPSDLTSKSNVASGNAAAPPECDTEPGCL